MARRVDREVALLNFLTEMELSRVLRSNRKKGKLEGFKARRRLQMHLSFPPGKASIDRIDRIESLDLIVHLPKKSA